MSETYNLADFTTPIPSGMEAGSEEDWRLPREVEAELQRKLREFDLHRARALVSAQNYIVL